MSEQPDVFDQLLAARAALRSLGRVPRQVRLGKRQVRELEQLTRCHLGHGRLQKIMGLAVVESVARDLLRVEE